MNIQPLQSNRIVWLDQARGIALFGILLANMLFDLGWGHFVKLRNDRNGTAVSVYQPKTENDSDLGGQFICGLYIDLFWKRGSGAKSRADGIQRANG